MPRTASLLSALLCVAFLWACGGDDDGPPPGDAAVDGPDAGADAGDAAADAFVEPDAGPYVPEELGRCDEFDPQRRPFFGDLHVHTALSLDAVTQGTRLRPDDAYRFAKGEQVGIQPFDAEGNALRTARLRRPLDFAMISDHAEFLGDLAVCADPERSGYDLRDCVTLRDDPSTAFVQFNLRLAMHQTGPRRSPICGAGGADCVDASRGPWSETRAAAETHYDRTSACRFTTFVGYEWSANPATENLHRNVVFRTERVPPTPTSYFDEPYPEGLWRALRDRCVDDRPGCDALTIPHNSNLSSGRMFEDVTRDGAPFDAEYAAERRFFEPLIEVFQHKGDSECLPGLPVADELCGFEKLPFDNLAGSNTGTTSPPPPSDFLRAALGEGLRHWQGLGEDPFQYGVIASTDTHLGTPGLVNEADMPGHGGAGTAARDSLPQGLVDFVGFNPGGLAVLWAEENSREALWAAMRRRETYGTSGPRIALRFFGGYAYADDLCGSASFVETGYADGVPMGGVLGAPAGEAAPVFAVSALRDPGAEGATGAPLERMQIVKGWVEGGEVRTTVIEVAGDTTGAATVDEATCETSGGGADSLCAVFRDPDFDPSEPAFYYARVVEVPTCRWHTMACNAAGIDCAAGGVPEAWEGCCDDTYPRTIQERAWSSPIWYLPE